MHKRLPLGVIIFGALLIVTSILQMQKFVSFDTYRRIFQQLPSWLVVLRYCISVALRLAGFVAGVGIFGRKNFARKLALIIAVFTICTIYWKHPYFVVYNYYKIIFYTLDNPAGATQLVLPQNLKLLTLVTLAGFYLIDIAFSLSLIYYFTREKVKTIFN